MRRARTRISSPALWAFVGLFLFGFGARNSSAQTFEAPLAIEGELILRVTRASTIVMVRVEDESGAPVQGALVRADADSLRACDGGPPSQRTGADGSVCLRAEDGDSLGDVRLSAEKEHFASASEGITLGTEDSRPELLIWPRVVDLERDELHPVEVVGLRRGPLTLSLACGEKSRELTRAQVDEGTSLRLEATTAAFQEYPGVCEMLAAQFGVESPTVRVLLRGTAVPKLVGLEAGGGALRIELEVSGRFGPVRSGVLELRQNGVLVAAVPVPGGRARFELAAEFSGQAATVLFVGSDPSLASGAPLELDLPRVEPSSTTRAWLSVPLILFLIWLAHRLSGASPRRTRPRTAQPSPDSKAAPLPAPLHGVVFDVDTHERLGGAAVELFRIEATRRERLSSATSAADGSFLLADVWSDQPDWEVECSAAGYEPLRLRPVGATLRVGLTAKRRALLRGFLKWLEVADFWPRHRRPLPTPLEAAARARQEGREDVVRWTEALNSHLYGPRSASDASEDDLPPEPPPIGALR